MKQHTLQIKETPGELYFELPDDILNNLGWEVGDELSFEDKGNGTFMITKVKMVDIELEFSDEELFKYMKHAHEQGCSLSEWVNRILKLALFEDKLDDLYDQKYPGVTGDH